MCSEIFGEVFALIHCVVVYQHVYDTYSTQEGSLVCTGPPIRGGQLGNFAPGPSLKGVPGGPMKGPLNTYLKDRYTLIEQSQYSSEERCSKLVDREIWLVRSSYCHCQQVMTFFFWSSAYSLGEVVIQNGNLLACRAPL